MGENVIRFFFWQFFCFESDMNVSDLTIKELKLEYRAAWLELRELGCDQLQATGRSRFVKQDWVREFSTALTLLKRWRTRAERIRIIRAKNRLSGDQTARHEGLLHLVLEWLCLPSSRYQSLSLASLRPYAQMCDIFALVSKRFQGIIRGKIFPMLGKYWRPPMRQFDGKEDVKGYMVWPDIALLKTQPFSTTIGVFRNFRRLFAHAKCYQTTVMKTISLTYAQLACLPQEVVSNPHHRSSESTLFNSLEVAEAAVVIYHTYENYLEHKLIPREKGASYERVRKLEETRKREQRMRTAAKRKETISRRKEESKRKQLLVEGLGQHGLELRDDSRLCLSFVKNDSPSLETVVTTMVEMNFFFQHTRYEKIRQQLANIAYEDRRARREELRFYHEDDIDPDEISSRAKRKAMECYDGDRKHVPPSLQNLCPEPKTRKRKVETLA